MTEVQWAECSDLELMFRYLRRKAVATDRKLRLFAAGCCRMVWELIPEGVFRASVELAERIADGSTGEQDAEEVRQAAWEVWGVKHREKNPAAFALDAAFWCSDSDAKNAAHRAAFLSWSAALEKAGGYDAALADAEEAKRRGLLREVIPKPLKRQQMSVATTQRTPTVIGLAQAAYDDRQLPAGLLDPSRLGVLADALEDAGCTDAELLGHLRGPGVHVRGCWAVDLLLGKS